MMKVIGITGGVGAGKSEVLKIIKEQCSCYILIADLCAHEIEQPGYVCYDKLVALLGTEILSETGEIDKAKMAARIFADDAGLMLKRVNEIVHPEVKSYILRMIQKKREEAQTEYFFIEAALLIEDGYTQICDELWYIYASKEVRRDRLMQSRGYSLEKVEQIMERQLEEAEFLKHCSVVIRNDKNLEDTKKQILEVLHSKSKDFEIG